MRELDKTKVYDLSELTSGELEDVYKATFRPFKMYKCLYYSYTTNYWVYSTALDKSISVNAKELFYTLENIQVDCRELSEEQIKKMADVFEMAGYKTWNYKQALDVSDVNYLLEFTGSEVFTSIGSEEKTTISYEKFMELFGYKEKSEEFNDLVDVNSGCRDLIGERIKEMVYPCVKNDYKVVNSNLEINKEENFKKLVEVLNEELTEEAYKETEYEVKYIAEKPKHPLTPVFDKAEEISENIQNVLKAYKETSNKLNYELDFNFITQLAERMAQNKHKYEPYNWQKLDNVDELKQALFRHVIEVMKGNYEDDNRLFGHLESISLNCMFINYQLNNK